jgi:hypothetical protein
LAIKLRDNIAVPLVFDGTSTTVVVDVALPPVSKAINSSLPTSLPGGTLSGINYTSSLAGSVLTLEFDSAPSSVTDLTLNVQLFYTL